MARTARPSSAPFWFIFLDRGTKAHDITPQSISHNGRRWKTSVQPNGPATGYGKPQALAFGGDGGQTVFARKVHRRAMRRNPIITRAAQQAAAAAVSAETVIGLWNRRSGKGRYTKTKAA